MPNSSRFIQLRAELSRARRHFLPRHFDPTGTTYSERKLDRTRAYRILAHAEIESFVEDILRSLVDQRFQQWQNSMQPSRVMVSLMAATEVSKKGNESVGQVIDRAVKRYRDIIGNNHGIRWRNFGVAVSTGRDRSS